MTQQLPTTVVTEALAHARSTIAWLRETDVFGLGIPTLHPDAGRIFVRQTLKMIAMSHPSDMMWVIANAHAGWDDADAALGDLAHEIAARGEPLPTFLQNYVLEQSHGLPRPRGPKKASHGLQNVFIVCLIWDLHQRFGLDPTRSSPHTASACDIVVMALNEADVGCLVTYKAVEKVWEKWGVGRFT